MVPSSLSPFLPSAPPTPKKQPKDWAAGGRHGRDHTNIINSLYIDPDECDKLNQHLTEKYAEIQQKEVRWEEVDCDDAQVVITAYGTPARIALTALELLREEGIRAGLFRPITLWPFPEQALAELSARENVRVILDVEMSSTGQMLDDVRLAVEGRKPIRFTGHAGGAIPSVEEIMDAARNALKEAN